MDKTKKILITAGVSAILIIAAIVIAVRAADGKRQAASTFLACPQFVTDEYVAGTALEGRDLSALIDGCTDVMTACEKTWDANGSCAYIFEGLSWTEGAGVTQFRAEAFPEPVAVLLLTDEDSVFCSPEGLNVAGSLAEAKTLAVVRRDSPVKFGSHYSCKYHPYVVSMSGRYMYSPDEYWSDSTDNALASLVNFIDFSRDAAANPLDRYEANTDRLISFDFDAFLKATDTAKPDGSIEYYVEGDSEIPADSSVIIPCYDLTGGCWRFGDFELNGDAPLYIMTSEITGELPIEGSYGEGFKAYVNIYSIRVYDCVSGGYSEFTWHPDTSARDAVSGSTVDDNMPPFVYYAA